IWPACIRKCARARWRRRKVDDGRREEADQEREAWRSGVDQDGQDDRGQIGSGPRVYGNARARDGGGERLTMAEEKKQIKNEKLGEVVSTKMAKTIVVRSDLARVYTEMRAREMAAAKG